MTLRRRTYSAAFTLLELVLVLVVLSTALAVAAPSMRAWSKGSKLRDAGDQFLSVTRWARSQAIADSRVYRLYVDPAAGQYWVAAQDGQEFVALGSGLGRVNVLSEDLRIQLTNLDVQGASQASTLEFVEFYPTGRAWPARVRITLDNGDATDIVCESPAEEFRLVSNAGGRS
ncbi:MAG: GspH/FimT family pseudopilin [Tepidisphaeraceae bacterium]